MKSKIIDELNLVDMSDAALKEYLGYMYESRKRLEEAKKSDPDIEQMTTALKQYISDNYGEEIKSYEARIKAARNQCKVRGIKYNVPDNVK